MKFRTGKIALASVALGAALCVPTAGSASADPTFCTSSYAGSYSSSSYCYASAPGTQFRAVVMCQFTTPTGSTDHQNWYGAWQTQGDPASSLATCGSGWGRYGKNTQTR